MRSAAHSIPCREGREVEFSCFHLTCKDHDPQNWRFPFFGPMLNITTLPFSKPRVAGISCVCIPTQLLSFAYKKKKIERLLSNSYLGFWFHSLNSQAVAHQCVYILFFTTLDKYGNFQLTLKLSKRRYMLTCGRLRT